MSIYTLDEIKEIVNPIFKKHKVSKAYLFGSYARNEADEKSDTDFRLDYQNIKNLFELGALYNDSSEALNSCND